MSKESQDKPTRRRAMRVGLGKFLLGAGAVGTLGGIGGKVILDDMADQKHLRLGEALLEACQEGDFSTAKHLLEEGADPNYVGGRIPSNSRPLGEALEGLHIDIVELLLKKEADQNAFQGNYSSALHLATIRTVLDHISGPNYSAKKSKEVIKLLVDAGGDINQTNANGDTPLDMILQDAQKWLIDSSSNSEADKITSARRMNDVLEIIDVMKERGATVTVENQKVIDMLHHNHGLPSHIVNDPTFDPHTVTVPTHLLDQGQPRT